MILSYLTHKKWTLPDSGVTVITLQSPIAYRDLVQDLKEKTICCFVAMETLILLK